jgi:hypothetical protein
MLPDHSQSIFHVYFIIHIHQQLLTVYITLLLLYSTFNIVYTETSCSNEEEYDYAKFLLG